MLKHIEHCGRLSMELKAKLDDLVRIKAKLLKLARVNYDFHPCRRESSCLNIYCYILQGEYGSGMVIVGLSCHMWQVYLIITIAQLAM